MIGIICKELSISANDLLGLHIVHDPMPSASEMEIVKKFRTLDAYGKETVSIILDREYTRAGAAISQQKPDPAHQRGRVPAGADHRRPRSGVDRALIFFVISRKRQKNPGHVRKKYETHDRNFPKEMYQ